MNQMYCIYNCNERCFYALTKVEDNSISFEEVDLVNDEKTPLIFFTLEDEKDSEKLGEVIEITTGMKEDNDFEIYCYDIPSYIDNEDKFYAYREIIANKYNGFLMEEEWDDCDMINVAISEANEITDVLHNYNLI